MSARAVQFRVQFFWNVGRHRRLLQTAASSFVDALLTSASFGIRGYTARVVVDTASTRAAFCLPFAFHICGQTHLVTELSFGSGRPSEI